MKLGCTGVTTVEITRKIRVATYCVREERIFNRMFAVWPIYSFVLQADENSTAYLTGKYVAFGVGIIVMIAGVIYALRSGTKKK